MTLNELINRLKEYRREMGGDAEVRLMTQQAWPFENRIVGVCSGEEMNDRSDDPDEDEYKAVEDDQVIYIVEGGQLGYGSKRAWEVVS